jgi:hypothetical protein
MVLVGGGLVVGVLVAVDGYELRPGNEHRRRRGVVEHLDLVDERGRVGECRFVGNGWFGRFGR